MNTIKSLFLKIFGCFSKSSSRQCLYVYESKDGMATWTEKQVFDWNGSEWIERQDPAQETKTEARDDVRLPN